VYLAADPFSDFIMDNGNKMYYSGTGTLCAGSKGFILPFGLMAGCFSVHNNRYDFGSIIT
jgi:hypothetical protein